MIHLEPILCPHNSHDGRLRIGRLHRLDLVEGLPQVEQHVPEVVRVALPPVEPTPDVHHARLRVDERVENWCVHHHTLSWSGESQYYWSAARGGGIKQGQGERRLHHSLHSTANWEGQMQQSANDTGHRRAPTIPDKGIDSECPLNTLYERSHSSLIEIKMEHRICLVMEKAFSNNLGCDSISQLRYQSCGNITRR